MVIVSAVAPKPEPQGKNHNRTHVTEAVAVWDLRLQKPGIPAAHPWCLVVFFRNFAKK